MVELSEQQLRDAANNLREEYGAEQGRERFKYLTMNMRDIVLINRVTNEVFGPPVEIPNNVVALRKEKGEAVAADKSDTEFAADAVIEAFTPLSPAELETAYLAPRTIAHNLIYADVRIRVAAGGTGKTTIALYEAVTLALGRPLWGHNVDSPQKTCIITREDSRPILCARMREIMAALALSEYEIFIVLQRVQIVDLTDIIFRLTCVVGDAVLPNTGWIDFLCEELAKFNPDWVIFDPLISFGVGEHRVNDAEQGLIEVFRIIRNRLNCCVEGIHHTGKNAAIDKRVDQYAARGGSALSDGARMVSVMVTLTPEEWLEKVGIALEEEEQGILLELPKISYCHAQSPIFIKRNGYQFEHIKPDLPTPDELKHEIDDKVWDFVNRQYKAGITYNTNSLAGDCREELGFSRDAIRAAANRLLASKRLQMSGVERQRGSHFIPLYD